MLNSTICLVLMSSKHAVPSSVSKVTSTRVSFWPSGAKASGSLHRCKRGPRHAPRAFYSTMQDVADIGSCNVHLTWSSNAANPHSRNARLITVAPSSIIPSPRHLHRLSFLETIILNIRLLYGYSQYFCDRMWCVLQRSFSAWHWEQLLRVLACSDMTLRQVVQRWPGIGDVSVAEVMNRLLCLKVPHWQLVAYE